MYQRPEALAVVALALAVLLPASGLATGTAPPLDVTAVSARRGDEGTWLRIRGNFPAGDLVQQPYPLQIVVRQLVGDRFAWFSLPSSKMHGAYPHLGTPPDAAVMNGMAAIAADAPGARLLRLAGEEIEIQLDPAFPSGPAEAFLAVLYEGAFVFSNTVVFEVQAEGGP